MRIRVGAVVEAVEIIEDVLFATRSSTIVDEDRNLIRADARLHVTAVGGRCDRLELALELAPGPQPVELEPSVVHGLEDGTARLARVGAIAEAALRRERLDVLEGRIDVALVQLELP